MENTFKQAESGKTLLCSGGAGPADQMQACGHVSAGGRRKRRDVSKGVFRRVHESALRGRRISFLSEGASVRRKAGSSCGGGCAKAESTPSSSSGTAREAHGISRSYPAEGQQDPGEIRKAAPDPYRRGTVVFEKRGGGVHRGGKNPCDYGIAEELRKIC